MPMPMPMPMPLRLSLLVAGLACAAAAPISGAWAQPSPPLTGQAPAAPAVPAPAAPAPAAAPVVRQVPAPARPDMAPRGSREVGDATRLLLAAQADGRRAGGELPMLGEAATRSWRRYMDSFSQPIPEWFDERVEDN